MGELERVVADIRSLRIQGSQSIAEAAMRAWVKARDKRAAYRKLYHARPTEPFLRNVLDYLMRYDDADALWEKMAADKEEIVRNGADKVRNGMVVYTHCHSSSVNRILTGAKRQKKRFRANVTETRPLYQGRTTAKQLAKARIPVTLFVDSAARLALKDADMMMIGADAVTAEGHVMNKIGSGLAAGVAKEYGVPVYVCTHSWKFEPKAVEMEQRSDNEVWSNTPHGVKISNHAFEKVDSSLIAAVISELGVMKPSRFVLEVERKNAWMFG
jgi:ribose 1,5-bisphosphate isomerase